VPTLLWLFECFEILDKWRCNKIQPQDIEPK
jgi:hypothetical protein